LHLLSGKYFCVWLISFVAKQRLKTVFCDIKVPLFMFLGKLCVVQNVLD
jgi:hypothetical protein